MRAVFLGALLGLAVFSLRASAQESSPQRSLQQNSTSAGPVPATTDSSKTGTSESFEQQRSVTLTRGHSSGSKADLAEKTQKSKDRTQRTERSGQLVSIDLSMLLAQALTSSGASRKLRLQQEISRSSVLQAQSPLDTQVFHNISVSDVSPDAFPQGPLKSEQSASWRSGIVKGFATGTQVQASFGALVGERNMRVMSSGLGAGSRGAAGEGGVGGGGSDDIDVFYGTDLKIEVTQNLLKNALGRSWKLAQEGAQNQHRATEYQIQSQLIALASRVVEGFFQLGVAQHLYRSDVTRHDKNEQIWTTAQILHERGNLETADLHQIETRKIAALQRQRQSLVNLNNAWDDVVAQFNLDPSWLRLDITGLDFQYRFEGDLPVKGLPESSNNSLEVRTAAGAPQVDSSGSGAYSPALCDASNIPWEQMPSYQNLKWRLKSSLSQLERASDNTSASLDAQVSYHLESRDGDAGEALRDTARTEHGSLTLQLSYKKALGNPSAKAGLWRASVARSEAQIALDQFRDDRASQIRQTCRRVQWLDSKAKLLKTIYQRHSQRAQLERERFEIGRQDFFSSTAVELERIGARHDLDVLLLDIAKEKWRLALLREDLSVITANLAMATNQ